MRLAGPTVDGGERQVVRKRRMEGGGWRMEGGTQRMKSGRWRMGNGGWKVGGGWRMEDEG